MKYLLVAINFVQVLAVNIAYDRECIRSINGSLLFYNIAGSFEIKTELPKDQNDNKSIYKLFSNMRNSNNNKRNPKYLANR